MGEYGTNSEEPKKSVLSLGFGDILDPHKGMEVLKGGARKLRDLFKSVEE